SASVTGQPASRSDAASASAEQHATPSPRASCRLGWALAFFAFAARVFAAFTAVACRCALIFAETFGLGGGFFAAGLAWAAFPRPGALPGWAAFALAAGGTMPFAGAAAWAGFFTTALPSSPSR